MSPGQQAYLTRFVTRSISNSLQAYFWERPFGFLRFRLRPKKSLLQLDAKIAFAAIHAIDSYFSEAAHSQATFQANTSENTEDTLKGGVS